MISQGIVTMSAKTSRSLLQFGVEALRTTTRSTRTQHRTFSQSCQRLRYGSSLPLFLLFTDLPLTPPRPRPQIHKPLLPRTGNPPQLSTRKDNNARSSNLTPTQPNLPLPTQKESPHRSYKSNSLRRGIHIETT